MIGTFYYGIGKKKTSISKVFIKKGNGKLFINGKNALFFFNRLNLLKIIYKPIVLINYFNLDIFISNYGGGESSKAYSMMYGISKSIINFDIKFKKILKKNNMLRRDHRIVERKKIGKVKARKSKQFSKR